MVGGLGRDSVGGIVSAQSTRMMWPLRVEEGKNAAGVKVDKGLAGDTEPSDPDVLAWEKGFIDFMEDVSRNEADLGSVYFTAGRSFQDVSVQTETYNWIVAIVGYVAMTLYCIISLGRGFSGFGLTSVGLTVAGVGAVGMGMLAGSGLASLAGMVFTPLSGITPILCLGQTFSPILAYRQL